MPDTNAAGSDRWDLSYLYRGFDDEAFRTDLASLPAEADALQAILKDPSLTPAARLEKLAGGERNGNVRAE